jgi:hypothetical protein
MRHLRVGEAASCGEFRGKGIRARSDAYVTPTRAAEILHLAVGTLAVWRCTKRYDLPYVKAGGRVRYDIRDIDAFIQKNRKETH